MTFLCKVTPCARRKRPILCTGRRKKEGVVFRAAHHSADATLWWHLDNRYVGEIRFRHELLLAPASGKHTLTVVDGEGHVTSIRFTMAE